MAWRRFLLVLIGISAAWFWSFVPPVSSGKQSLVRSSFLLFSETRCCTDTTFLLFPHQRHSYSKMISTIGDGLCAILSEADEKIEDPEEHLRIEKSEWLSFPCTRRNRQLLIASSSSFFRSDRHEEEAQPIRSFVPDFRRSRLPFLSLPLTFTLHDSSSSHQSDTTL